MELDVENYCVCKQKYMNEEKEEMVKEIKALKNKINELEDTNEDSNKETSGADWIKGYNKWKEQKKKL